MPGFVKYDFVKSTSLYSKPILVVMVFNAIEVMHLNGKSQVYKTDIH